MALRLILPALSVLAAFAQQSTTTTFSGTVEKIVGNEVQIKTGKRTFSVYADEKTEVSVLRTIHDTEREVETDHDLSRLQVGNEVMGTCDFWSRRTVAISIWILPHFLFGRPGSILTFRAVVTKASPFVLEVLAIAGADSVSHPKENRVVFLDSSTVFNTSRRKVVVGETLEVVGWDLGNGYANARRITVYNTDLPVFMDLRLRPRR